MFDYEEIDRTVRDNKLPLHKIEGSEKVKWYRKAIDTDGYVAPEALLGLGNCYASGHGVEQDWEKAAEFYREAADMCDPQAQYLLAGCYAEGNGVGQDMAEAVKLYKRAATNTCENKGYFGHAGAMRCLADCYANGNGVRKNAKQATAWYAKAEELEADSKTC
ncbi:MAG: sel1 repeat family protein [Bacteroidales bacterium]|nr:sel1 repeat family protein [Bacteroidales bacterium]MCM1146762.1 sel1 repeat family protein [Bacteroidales bacterium]MCM1205741.1 sel1 repeat family protein [Bacillota bacterium]MCM1510729.1 sel1 repeat family protein [Clostridium sp.]